jgi:hypothetical protein
VGMMIFEKWILEIVILVILEKEIFVTGILVKVISR